MHLTNVAIQKKGRGYNAVHGGKWSTRYLRLFVDGTRGPGSGDALFRRIEQLIVHSLKAVQPVIVHNKVSKRVLSSLTICVFRAAVAALGPGLLPHRTYMRRPFTLFTFSTASSVMVMMCSLMIC
jgi:hypothetical protein